MYSFVELYNVFLISFVIFVIWNKTFQNIFLFGIFQTDCSVNYLNWLCWNFNTSLIDIALDKCSNGLHVHYLLSTKNMLGDQTIIEYLTYTTQKMLQDIFMSLTFSVYWVTVWCLPYGVRNACNYINKKKYIRKPTEKSSFFCPLQIQVYSGAQS